MQDRDRLCDDDARILGLESATITGHTLKLLVLEPGTGPLDLDALRAHVVKRLPIQPRATQRVDVSGAEPRWVDATGFDIGEHAACDVRLCLARGSLAGGQRVDV